MPTYEYQCSECGYAFEEFQSITAPAIRRCPECSKNKVQRLIGCGSAVIFKGKGFYQTDYRSDSYKKAAEADKPQAASSTKDSGGGSDGGKKTEAQALAQTSKSTDKQAT
ncbi:MAG: zinc ribbon domain-containing protein [Planctomycetes bacterium]|nr:zinc ribbon domain-containing protein [Planctomycetota bacterium]